MEGEQTHGRTAATRALAMSGFPVLGAMLANLLTRGFSWRGLGAMAVIWAVLFAVLLPFSGRMRFRRRR